MGYPSEKRILLLVLLVGLFLLSPSAIQTAAAQTVPSPVCLGSCPTILPSIPPETSSPTLPISVTLPQGGNQPSGAPIIEPCTNNIMTTEAADNKTPKRYKSSGDGLMKMLLDLINLLIKFLERLIGMQPGLPENSPPIPVPTAAVEPTTTVEPTVPVTTPCPPTANPTIVIPTSQPSIQPSIVPPTSKPTISISVKTPTPSSVTATPPSSTAQEIAKRILATPNIKLLNDSDKDMQAAAGGKLINNASSCGNSVRLHPALLSLMLQLGQNHTYDVWNIVSLHGCDRFLHPKGRATDIGQADGKGSWQNRPFRQDTANLLPTGGGLGQQGCPGTPNVTSKNKISQFADKCNHQHIDVGSQIP